MTSNALELDHVDVAFAGQLVLQDVSLTILPGECVVLVGPSGAGKSVILKLFAGILVPDQGRILIEGTDLASASEQDRVRLLLKMGMQFQKNALFDSLRCGENIGFPLRETSSLPEAEIEEKITQFLAAVGLSHARDLFPSETSGGMQKRLGIARALALGPSIVLYDDPTAGLDPITSRMIVDLILELKKKNNSTVVAVTNDMMRAFQMADRIIMVADQTLIDAGNVQQTMNHKDPRIRQFVRGELSGPMTA